ncbi:MAG: hypothetical protein SZ59_C0002G0101 [candidate division TM6 bacterium GW2011_GWF2_28_16]|nr:MAG: hypothetical protein SZ59_C0002G0101 [candidate division TM6 bacterium GW2011_GWF2_28_16]
MKKLFSFIFVSSLILSSANSICYDDPEDTSSEETKLFESIEILDKPNQSDIEKYVSRFDQIFLYLFIKENSDSKTAISKAQQSLKDIEQKNIDDIINMLKKYGYSAKINEDKKLEISISVYQLTKKLAKNKLLQLPKGIKNLIKNNYGKIIIPVTLAGAIAIYLKCKENPSEILPVINENFNNLWESLGNNWDSLVKFWQENKFELFPKEI